MSRLGLYILELQLTINLLMNLSIIFSINWSVVSFKESQEMLKNDSASLRPRWHPEISFFISNFFFFNFIIF